MLSLKSISKSYGKKVILKDISINIEKGSCVAIAGKNSEGKTTLLSIAAGRIKNFGGQRELNGIASFVPQSEELLPQLSVEDHVRLWYSACKKPLGSIFSEDSFEHKLGLLEYRKQIVGKLSGGRRKRLAIALALISNPDILIMDEPFSSLDIVSRDEVCQILRNIVALKKALLISTHIIAPCADLWDRVVVLDSGIIIADINQREKNYPPQELEKIVVDSFI